MRKIFKEKNTNTTTNNNKYTNKDTSWRMKCIKLSGILRYNPITDSWTDDQNQYKNIVEKKKRICRIEDFAVPTDHRVKINEKKRRDIYLCYVAGSLICINVSFRKVQIDSFFKYEMKGLLPSFFFFNRSS